jgi:hypothetical protein
MCAPSILEMAEMLRTPVCRTQVRSDETVNVFTPEAQQCPLSAQPNHRNARGAPCGVIADPGPRDFQQSRHVIQREQRSGLGLLTGHKFTSVKTTNAELVVIIILAHASTRILLRINERAGDYDHRSAPMTDIRSLAPIRSGYDERFATARGYCLLVGNFDDQGLSLAIDSCSYLHILRSLRIPNFFRSPSSLLRGDGY